MLAKKEVEEAVFWDRFVCLDCQLVIETSEESFDNCEVCGGKDILPAARVLKCLEVVERGDEE